MVCDSRINKSVTYRTINSAALSGKLVLYSNSPSFWNEFFHGRECVCTCVCTHVENRGRLERLPLSFFTWFFEIGFLTEPETHDLASLTGQWGEPEGSVCVYLPSVGIKGLCHHMAIQYEFLGRNLGPPCLQDIPLLVSHLPSPQIYFLFQSSKFKSCSRIELPWTYSN